MTGRARPGAWAGALGVGLAVLAWLAATAGWRPLMLPDEGRYVGVAWELLRSGHWLTPTLDGLPFFHKPPLFYWINAAALALLGPTELAGRVASLLGAAGGALALYLLLRRWRGAAPARAALVVLLSLPLWFLGAQFANLDMLVAGCISATIVLLAHAVLLQRAGRSARGALLGAWALAALGVLAKGLIGFVLPGAVVLAWLLWQGWWRTLPRLLWWPGPLLFLGIAGPWFVAMQRSYPGFFDYFIVEQHLRRYAAGGFNNVQPPWFYPAALAALALPWLPWLAGVRHAAWWRGTTADPAGPVDRAAGAGDAALPLRRLALTWLAVVVVFFSLPQSKLVGYVLPAVPPLALLIADAAQTVAAGRAWRHRAWAASALLSAALGLAAVAVLALAHPKSDRALGRLLAQQRGAGEPVLFVDGYFYDLPFYAGLSAPVPVFKNWRDPSIARVDDWRKELADAGRFDAARAQALLRQPDQLPAALCAAPRSWVVGSVAARGLPLFGAAIELGRSERATLWRFERDAAQRAGRLQCPPAAAGG